jgi:hypothetical protein
VNKCDSVFYYLFVIQWLLDKKCLVEARPVNPWKRIILFTDLILVPPPFPHLQTHSLTIPKPNGAQKSDETDGDNERRKTRDDIDGPWRKCGALIPGRAPPQNYVAGRQDSISTVANLEGRKLWSSNELVTCSLRNIETVTHDPQGCLMFEDGTNKQTQSLQTMLMVMMIESNQDHTWRNMGGRHPTQARQFWYEY